MMMSMSMMPQHPIAITNHALATSESREIVTSRFGEIVIDRRNALYFPKGVLGMPDRHQFALAEFPSEKMQQFKLLQSLDDEQLSFIALPVAADNGLIRLEDMRAACRDLAMREEDALMLLIVCVHRQEGQTRLSVNARAPILIDALRKVGMQYVFSQDYYHVQHYIT